ncbi:MAG TPA: FUSC family protein [Bradyrhizobium sp.]|nr:FUSC family protein [Bradyrhizobium sp.]
MNTVTNPVNVAVPADWSSKSGVRRQSSVIRAIAFVTRCSGSSTIAYELASALGLPQSLWAAMSAVIVSQERLHETRSSLYGRILGTLLGIGVTVAVSEAASRMAVSTAVQMLVDVAICGVVARRFPRLRVAMWTCPIILLTAQPTLPILVVALRRGSEVVLGALVGWAFHGAAEVVVDALTGAKRRRSAA